MPVLRLVDEPPALSAPVIVAAFDGWVDAASAASHAVERLGSGGKIIASFDPDKLYDYRSRRPILDVVDGRLDGLVWPELVLRHATVGGRDVLALSGHEPDIGWRELAEDLVQMIRQLGVTEWISIGAVPAAVVHTRPVPLLATVSGDGVLRNGEQLGPTGILRVPAAALSVLELAVSGAGTPAVGFFAQVPPYVGSGYTAATLALLDHVARHLDISLDLHDLAAEAADQRRDYDTAVIADPELRDAVSRLDGASDAEEVEQLPTGEEIAAEIERFLRDQRGEKRDGPLGGPGS